MELMLMMEPPSGPISLTASWVVSSRPRTLRSNCLWKCSGVMAAEGLEVVDAGVVDEDVELAEGVLGLGEEAGDVGGFGDVCLHGDGLAALGLDVGDDGVGAGLAAGVVDDDRGALGGEMLGDGGTDALGGACDHCDFACKIAHRIPFPFEVSSILR